MTPRDIVAPEPVAPAQAAEEAREPTLVERYRAIAHEFRPRPIDHVLRALDLVLGCIVLAAVAPLLVLCGLAVLASGGAPLVYRGTRVGRNGEVFSMYKLRTLRAGAEARLGPYYGDELTLRTQDELTLVGRGLRRLKLDELPQLVNVVRGEMSMVGPRPIRPTFFEELCETIPAYWQRLVVRPGITGLAQLRLSREMTWDEKLAHDFEYIADRSVGLYLAVLAQTAVLLAGRLAGRR